MIEFEQLKKIIEKNQEKKLKAGLYVVGTPIGNLEDISLRALRILDSADIIIAEDTRVTMKLLSAYDIHGKELISFNQHNQYGKIDKILSEIENDKLVALVSDAGMPCISDPGLEIVRQARIQGIYVTVIPSATAFVTALCLSGMDTGEITFVGFLSSKNKERKEQLEKYKNESNSIILYESPHHLIATLRDICSYFGEDRQICICRELTKIHEESMILTIGKAIDYYQSINPRGEYVLVVAGKDISEIICQNKEEWEEISVVQHVEKYMTEGLDKKSAIKEVATIRNLPKREVYKQCIDVEP